MHLISIPFHLPSEVIFNVKSGPHQSPVKPKECVQNDNQFIKKQLNTYKYKHHLIIELIGKAENNGRMCQA